MNNPFSASWSKQGHNLCLGQWCIAYQGRQLTLPEARRDTDMGTFGNFSFLFEDDPAFEEGQDEDSWIIDNADWLVELFEAHSIPFDEQHLRWFYQAVNPADWRCSSCGGCV